ncbi:PREDICTED: pectin acetylesterase 11-like isoform X2 [Branchiostoma belcheri]|uniref:Pectin acetylesterase 11-like isoform X2 n=1 Tax=Branchiostoma belcheri TaxID=7741 RepID=A0A6P4Z1R8_BRABE|nr:PREDICTED: pectin acetylesterase 11-like isoform X2 [Branchiostoma belcheri]
MQSDSVETLEDVPAIIYIMKRLKTKRKLLKILVATMCFLGAAQVAFRCQKTSNQDEEKSASRLEVVQKWSPFHVIRNQLNSSLVANSSADRDERPQMQLRLLSTHAANQTGAFCLDGSAPGYYFQPGVAAGLRKWVIYLPGGEACFTLEACRKRTLQTKGLGPGTTRKLANTTKGHALRSADKTINPEFWDWNMVEAVYCDGFFFSAGAVAVLRHASWFREQLPLTVNFRVFAASAAFPMLRSVRTGRFFNETTLFPAVIMHHAARSVPKACLQEADPSGLTLKCHEPFGLLQYQSAPLFVAGYVYDAWMLDNSLEARCTPKTCRGASEREGLKNLSREISETLPGLLKPQDGMFIVNCKKHFIITEHNTWTAGVTVQGVTAAKAFTDWFYGRGNSHRHMDCVTFQCYPNPTCTKARL